MRITCPACDAAYDVPEALLTRPRLVRCARCAHDFRPPLDDDPIVEAAVESVSYADAPVPAAGPVREDALPARPLPARPPVVSNAERAKILAAWAASFVAIAAFAWLGIVYRRPVIHAWPPSARLYAALGYAHLAPSAQKQP
jgi:predicted Zn finger-like uncharacterized protein